MPHHTIFGGAPPPTPSMQLSKVVMKLLGARVSVEISAPPAYAAALTAASRPIPAPVVGMGLIDTGASDTSIDDAIAVSLGLQVVNRVSVQTPNATLTTNVYVAQIAFPGTHLPVLPTQFVAGTTLANQGLAALIGRDFLIDKLLHYDGILGVTTLSW